MTGSAAAARAESEGVCSKSVHRSCARNPRAPPDVEKQQQNHVRQLPDSGGFSEWGRVPQARLRGHDSILLGAPRQQVPIVAEAGRGVSDSAAGHRTSPALPPHRHRPRRQQQRGGGRQRRCDTRHAGVHPPPPSIQHGAAQQRGAARQVWLCGAAEVLLPCAVAEQRVLSVHQAGAGPHRAWPPGAEKLQLQNPPCQRVGGVPAPLQHQVLQRASVWARLQHSRSVPRGAVPSGPGDHLHDGQCWVHHALHSLGRVLQQNGGAVGVLVPTQRRVLHVLPPSLQGVADSPGRGRHPQVSLWSAVSEACVWGWAVILWWGGGWNFSNLLSVGEYSWQGTLFLSVCMFARFLDLLSRGWTLSEIKCLFCSRCVPDWTGIQTAEQGEEQVLSVSHLMDSPPVKSAIVFLSALIRLPRSRTHSFPILHRF